MQSKFLAVGSVVPWAERECRMHLLGRRAADDDGRSSMVCLVDRPDVGDVVEDQSTLEIHRSLEHDLRDLATGRPEPALAHQKAIVSPGSGARISTPGGASSRSASGVPVSRGNVP